jgi:hypothetical protein
VVPGTASGAATLQFLLDDPDMAALAESPPMRRLLRPLCRLLGVTPPAATAKPPCQAAARPVAIDSASDKPPEPPPAPRRDVFAPAV